MKTYEVELKRTSYVLVTVEAQDEEHAEDLAWVNLEVDAENGYADWSVEFVKEVK